MGYDSLMINGDERIEVRDMRVPRSRSGPGWWPARTPRRPCGRDPFLELARDNEVLITAYFPLAHGRVLDDQMLTWTGGSRREKFEIELLTTDGRTANPPWAPAWNA